ncbi:MAG: hypothetical protein O7C67_11460, partial [Gammaproteobacteria bacterium]|nr:hypothetical protein [Gammaproteobacteria bacterium]
VELPAWKLQGFNGFPAKTLQYAAADLQGMGPLHRRGGLPRAKLGASRKCCKQHLRQFGPAQTAKLRRCLSQATSRKKSRTDFFRDD